LWRWNAAEREAAVEEILACCGSRVWAEAMAARRPVAGLDEMLQAAREIWWDLSDADWMEAFRSHPRIGESKEESNDGSNVGSNDAKASTKSREWSADEQRKVTDGGDEMKTELAEANRTYEEHFGRLFIVCATGKAPSEILEILRSRLQNDDAAEMREAADEQLKITELRLRKWMGE
jgi:2-oxo-4-hydroxy-4-carboxy-5-ureidoimidazoline decarboxylase